MDYTEIHNQVKREFTCDHARTQLAKMTATNGVVHYRIQCVQCGHLVSIPKSGTLSVRERQDAVPFDDNLRDQWWKRQMAREEKLRDDMRNQEKQEFDEWYEEYLESPEWYDRRRLVFKRANGRCEGCGEGPAVQVHHLSYDHVGNEFLWELVAVCRSCHDRAHEKKRTTSGTTFADAQAASRDCPDCGDQGQVVVYHRSGNGTVAALCECAAGQWLYRERSGDSSLKGSHVRLSDVKNGTTPYLIDPVLKNDTVRLRPR